MSFESFFGSPKAHRSNVPMPTDIDLVEALRAEGFDLKKTGKSWAGSTCPACGPGSNSSVKLSVFEGTDGRQRWRCFSCGEHGDFADFLAHSRQVSLREALGLARGMHSVGGLTQVKRQSPNAQSKVKDTLSTEAIEAMAKVHEGLLRGAHRNPDEVMPYFESRQLSRKTVMKLVDKNMMRFLPVAQYDAYRLLSEVVGRPTLEAAGMWKEDAQWPAASYRPIISFLPRGCSIELRLNHTPGVNAPKAIRYGTARFPWFYKEEDRAAKRIIIVEGIIDLMSMIELGLNRHDDAIMGVPGTNGWKPEWFEQALVKNPGAEYIIAMDANVAGSVAAEKISKHLSHMKVKHQRATPRGEAQDWNDYLQASRAQEAFTGTDN
jgi:hypothetical protein